MDIAELGRHFDDHNAVVTAAIERAGAKSAALETKVSGLEESVGGVREDLRAMQQRGVRNGGSGLGVEHKSIGQQFAESEELKTFREVRSRPSRVRLELKTITSTPSSGLDLIIPARDTTLMMPKQPLRVVDMLPTINVTSGSVEFAKQIQRDLMANVVGEGAVKPESALAWTLITVPIRTIAHWIAASRQVLDDADQLRGLIDTDLLYGVRLREEIEVISGDGTGYHVLGLIAAATSYAAPIVVASPTSIDQLGLAILQCALANFSPNAVVLHPADLARIRLLKDTQGKYLVNDNPAVGMPPTLFGVALVPSQGISVDKFLVLDTTAAATVYRRQTPIVEASTEHSDFFVRNLCAILAESRLGLAIRWAGAGAAIYGDFGLVA